MIIDDTNMPANRKGRCDRCTKQRTDLELCGDDLLCRPCEVQNEVELTKIKLSVNVMPSHDLPVNDKHAQLCQSCSGTVELTKSLCCDICGLMYHIHCAEISEDVFAVLSQIIEEI